MESNTHTTLGFIWVKKEGLQSNTKIQARDDSPQKTTGPKFVAAKDQPPQDSCSQPHHQWIPKNLLHFDGKG